MKYVLIIVLVIYISSQFLHEEEALSFYLQDNVSQDVKLNITDMTVNSLIYILDKKDYIYTIKNKTGLPINIDSKGLAMVIPELEERFPENTELEIIVYKIIEHEAPVLETYITGTSVKFQFGLNLANKDDILMSCTIMGNAKFQIFTNDNLLNIYVSSLTIDNINVLGGSLSINYDIFKTNLNMVVRIALKQLKENLKNIKILDLINDKLKTHYTQISILQNRGYNYITLN